MINAAIALVVDVIAMAILLFATDLGVYAIVVAMIIYAVVMCLLNERAMKQYMQYKNPWRSAYLNPLLASVPMAVVAGFSYYGSPQSGNSEGFRVVFFRNTNRG